MNTTSYFPTYDGDTSGPYYARLDLVRADDKRMIGLERAQIRQTMWAELAVFALVVLAICFSL